LLSSIFAIFLKDLKSELRTRYALNALFMFVVVTISVILFSTAGESLGGTLLSGLLWVVIFFSAMSGLSRTFVSEEDRGTFFNSQRDLARFISGNCFLILL